MAWLGTYAKRRRIKFPAATVSETVSDIPTPIYINSSCGTNDEDFTDIFTDLGASYLKIAVTDSDGTSQMYVEIEVWDHSNGYAAIWVNSATHTFTTAEKFLYIYYDSTQSDNSTYVGVSRSTPAENVWGDTDEFVYLMNSTPSGTDSVLDSSPNHNDGTSYTLDSSDMITDEYGAGYFFGAYHSIVLAAATDNDFRLAADNEGSTVIALAKLTSSAASSLYSYGSLHEADGSADDHINFSQHYNSTSVYTSTAVDGSYSLSQATEYQHETHGFVMCNKHEDFTSIAVDGSLLKTMASPTGYDSIIAASYHRFHRIGSVYDESVDGGSVIGFSYGGNIYLVWFRRESMPQSWCNLVSGLVSDSTFSIGSAERANGDVFMSEVSMEIVDAENSKGLTFKSYSWLGTWQYRVKIHVDSGDMIESTDQKFPTPLYIRATSGENNQDLTHVFDTLGTNYQKIAVTDESGTDQFYVEVEVWDTTAEIALLWVNRSDWHFQQFRDNTLYLYYDADEANNTTYVNKARTGNSEEVWNTGEDEIFVFTMAQDPTDGGACVLDSTENHNDGTNYGGITQSQWVTTSLGKAIDFDGDDDKYIGFPVTTQNNPFKSNEKEFTVVVGMEGGGMAWSCIDHDTEFGTWIGRPTGILFGLNQFYSSGYSSNPCYVGNEGDPMCYSGRVDIVGDECYGFKNGWRSLDAVRDCDITFLNIANGVMHSISGGWFNDPPVRMLSFNGTISFFWYRKTIETDEWYRMFSDAFLDTLFTFDAIEDQNKVVEPPDTAFEFFGEIPFLIVGPVEVIEAGDMQMTLSSSITAATINYHVNVPETKFRLVKEELGETAFDLSNAVIVYELILTGAPDGTTDLTLPLYKVSVRREAGNKKYAQLVIPGDKHISDIYDRMSGAIQIYIQYLDFAGEEILTAKIFDADLIGLDFIKKMDGIYLLLIAEEDEQKSTKAISMIDPSYSSVQDGKRIFRFPKPDSFLNPGDVVSITGEETLAVASLSYYLTPEMKVFEIIEE